MAAPTAIPEDAYLDAPNPAEFLAECLSPNRLIYFLLNVGDGDTQLILLPPIDGKRRAMVVDVSGDHEGKLPALIVAMQGAGVLPSPDSDAGGARSKLFPIVVGTHPHDDHIGGMPGFLRLFGGEVGEYWDPGYYHPTKAFIDTMKQLEDQPHVVWTQPSSGLRRHVDDVRVTVLAPGIVLKNQYDSYGIDPNNASITLKLEYPFRRVQERTSRVAGEPVPADEQVAGRLYAKIPRARSLVLGADAQARSWAQVQADFPKLEARFSPVFEQLEMARGLDPLTADVFKVSHHASKRGVYLEVMELLIRRCAWCRRSVAVANTPSRTRLPRKRSGRLVRSWQPIPRPSARKTTSWPCTTRRIAARRAGRRVRLAVSRWWSRLAPTRPCTSGASAMLRTATSP